MGKLTKPEEVIAAMLVHNEELVVDGKLAYVGSRRVSAGASASTGLHLSALFESARQERKRANA